MERKMISLIPKIKVEVSKNLGVQVNAAVLERRLAVAEVRKLIQKGFRPVTEVTRSGNGTVRLPQDMLVNDNLVLVDASNLYNGMPTNQTYIVYSDK